MIAERASGHGGLTTRLGAGVESDKLQEGARVVADVSVRGVLDVAMSSVIGLFFPVLP